MQPCIFTTNYILGAISAMGRNIKLGNDVINDIETVKIEDANNSGQYVAFSLGSTISGGHSVKFINYDDNTYAISMVQSGGSVSAPVNPTKPSASFSGWNSVKGDASTRVTFPYTPQSDEVSLYADFTDVLVLHDGDVIVFKDNINISISGQYNINFKNSSYNNYEFIYIDFYDNYFKYGFTNNNNNNSLIAYANNNWYSTLYKTITISGDQNITDETFINWLYENVESGLPLR